MGRIAENGITEFTCTLLRDKLNLDKEAGRDQIRRAMRRLETEDKVTIGLKQRGKRKRYIIKLKGKQIGGCEMVVCLLQAERSKLPTLWLV